MPGLEQGVRQQGQGARCVLEIVQDEVRRDPASSGPAAVLGRTGDRPPQLVGRHRADVLLLARDGAPQVRVRGEVGVEVGAERDDHRDRPVHGDRGHEVRDESAPLRLVPAQREQLLELVDDEQDPVAVAPRPATRQADGREVERSRLGRQVVDERGRRTQRALGGAQAQRERLERVGGRRDDVAAVAARPRGSSRRRGRPGRASSCRCRRRRPPRAAGWRGSARRGVPSGARDRRTTPHRRRRSTRGPR